MMDTVVYYQETERLRALSETDCLELAYQENLGKSDLIAKEEGARRLRLQILLLEAENDDLHEQLAIEDDRIDELEREKEELQRRLEYEEAESRRHEYQLRLQTRDLNNMKAELNAMSGLSSDSTKLLTEKLSLARELSIVKPELEHLRNQAIFQQTVLADKLELQRQVHALEVELETQKRVSTRVSNKEKDVEKQTELQKELNGLRMELAKEKRDREKAKLTTDKISNDWETRNNVLDNRVEKLRAKLQETKEQLKETRTELTQVRAQVALPKAAVSAEVPAKCSRKRNAQQISSDAIIGTPDGVAVRGRRPGGSRGRPEPTLLGEKSMFSITPYLNRTTSVAPETPHGDFKMAGLADEDAQIEENTVGGSPSALATEVEKDTLGSSEPKISGRQKLSVENILEDAKNGIARSNLVSKKSRMMGTLEKVTEEEVCEDVDTVVSDVKVDPKMSSLKLLAPTVDHVGPRKKKRKVLGAMRSLFDEEDGEATKRPAKAKVGSARPIVRGGVSLTMPALGAFGVFSPLKKDKRGTQASFLL